MSFGFNSDDVTPLPRHLHAVWTVDEESSAESRDRNSTVAIREDDDENLRAQIESDELLAQLLSVEEDACFTSRIDGEDTRTAALAPSSSAQYGSLPDNLDLFFSSPSLEHSVRERTSGLAARARLSDLPQVHDGTYSNPTRELYARHGRNPDTGRRFGVAPRERFKIRRNTPQWKIDRAKIPVKDRWPLTSRKAKRACMSCWSGPGRCKCPW